jgi:hypothetical protein
MKLLKYLFLVGSLILVIYLILMRIREVSEHGYR